MSTAPRKTITARRVLSTTPPDASGDQAWGASQTPQTPFLTPAELQLQALQQFDDDDTETEVDRVAALLQQASTLSRAEVKIYKVENGNSVYCQMFTPSEFEEGGYDMLRDAFGAGRFKIMLYGTNPQSGRFGILARNEVTIAESRVKKETQSSTGNNSELAQVIAMLAQGQQQINERLAAMANVPPVDPMANMTQMLALMGSMRTAMGLDVQSQQRPQNSIAEIVGAIKALKEASEEFSPREKEETSLLGLAGQVLPMIQQGMQQSQQRQTAPHEYSGNPLPIIQAPASLNPTAAPAVDPSQPLNTQENEAMKLAQLNELKTQLATLLKMAKENQDQDKSAAFVHEQLPDEMIEILDSDQWFDMLCLIEPEAKNYQPWFESVRAKVVALLDAEDAAQTQNLPNS